MEAYNDNVILTFFNGKDELEMSLPSRLALIASERVHSEALLVLNM